MDNQTNLAGNSALEREQGKSDIPEPDLSRLRLAAIKAAEHAYAPYSGFRVGSALQLTNGEIVAGANVENVSYGLTICAERSAVVRAVALYGPKIRVTAVVVVNLNDAASPPCGACRQVLAEFVEPDATITFPTIDGTKVAIITSSFRELLPYAFDLKL